MMFHMAEVAIGAAAARLLVSGCAQGSDAGFLHAREGDLERN